MEWESYLEALRDARSSFAWREHPLARLNTNVPPYFALTFPGCSVWFIPYRDRLLKSCQAPVLRNRARDISTYVMASAMSQNVVENPSYSFSQAPMSTASGNKEHSFYP